jgi:threonine dehydrogenase-like Zn-dependent dehydrogenase
VKAVAVFRSGETGARLIDVPMPRLDDVGGGRGVLVRVLRVGVDGTDKEILSGEYGAPPPGDPFLITGHESFGVVEEIASNVSGLCAAATTSWRRCAGRDRASTTTSEHTT